MNTETQAEALRLADALENGSYLLSVERAATCAELRRLHAIEAEHIKLCRDYQDTWDSRDRLHAENQQLRTDLEAVGAGGVGPLMPTAAQQPSVGYRRAIMGFGRVAVGGCKGADNQLPGIIYLDMDGEQREPDTPCDDLFQPGTAPDPSKILACIHFSTAASVFQTIDVLHELLEDEFGIAQQQPKAQD